MRKVALFFVLVFFYCLAHKRDTEITIKKMIDQPSCHITIAYPHVHGLPASAIEQAINEKLLNGFLAEKSWISKPNYEPTSDTDERPETLEVEYKAQVLKKIIQIHKRGWYYGGGAHGMSFEHVYHIDTTTGQFYTLGDLLQKPESLHALHALAQEAFDASDKTYFQVEHLDSLKPDQDFYCTKQGLHLFYHPYAIAAFCRGFVDFLIPWQKLKSIVKPNHPIVQSFASDAL